MKRIYREGEMAILKPENGEHEDLVVSAQDMLIQGRVVHVIHPQGDEEALQKVYGKEKDGVTPKSNRRA